MQPVPPQRIVDGGLPLLLHFLNFPLNEAFVTKYKNKLEELNNNPFIKQNYGHEDERSFKFASKSKHLFFDEICIIEDIQNAQRQYLWKEFFVEDKRGLLELIAICELRMELQRNNNLGLVPLFRYMYKEVPHGWMSSRFRIRVLLEWNPNPGQFIADKIANYDRVKPTTASIRTFFTNMLSVLTHLHKEEIFIIDLRPEYIICDETNNQQPFRLFDRLVEGVDPIKRISQSRNRGWTPYCHSKIWEIYCKQTEDAYKKELFKIDLLAALDVFALAMIALQLGTGKDFSFLYIFNGRFNQEQFDSILTGFRTDRELEDPYLFRILNSILTLPIPTTVKHASYYLELIKQNPPTSSVQDSRPQNLPSSRPEQHVRPIAEARVSKPSTNPPEAIQQNPPTPNSPKNVQVEGDYGSQGSKNILVPVIPSENSAVKNQNQKPPSTGSDAKVAKELITELVPQESSGKPQAELNKTDPQTQQVPQKKNEPSNKFSTIQTDPELEGLRLTTVDQPVLANQRESQPDNNESNVLAPKPKDPKQTPTTILKVQPNNPKERSGCPCCTLI